MINMKAIILAAGLGTRMGEFGKEIPKCLLKIGEKTLLEIQTDILKRCGIKDIVVVIGKEGLCWTKENQDKIKNIAPLTIINEINHKTHNTYSLKLALDKISTDDIIIIDGDVIFQKKIVEEVMQDKRNIILSKKIHNVMSEGNKIFINNGGKVLGMSRNVPQEFLHHQLYIYSGIKKIQREYVSELKKIINEKKYHDKDLGYVIDDICKIISLYNYPQEKIVNINRPEEWNEAKKMSEIFFVVIMQGYTATGKSTIAKKMSIIPNTVVYHSALIRKDLGLSPKSVEEADKFFNYDNNLRLEIDKKVYRNLAEKIKENIQQKRNIILD